MVIVEFVDMAPPGAESSFYPVTPGKGYFNDSSFVIMGIIVLALPSVVLARAGAAMHLDIRSRRYGLLRTLGTPPRQMAAIIAADMAVPLLSRRAAWARLPTPQPCRPWMSFTLAGTSYWTRDLLAPHGVRGSYSAGYHSRGPGQHRSDCPPRRPRPPSACCDGIAVGAVSYLTYLSLAGLPAAAAAVLASGEVAESNFTLSVWLIMSGMLFGVVGLLGADPDDGHPCGHSSIRPDAGAGCGIQDVSFGRRCAAGRVRDRGCSLLDRIHHLLDVRPPDAGCRYVRRCGPAGQLRQASPTGCGAVALYEGVTRVVYSSRVRARVDGERIWVHTITCEDVPGSVELDAPCVNGSIYFQQPSEASSVGVDADLEVISGYRTVDRGDGSTVELAVRVPDPEETVSGTHAVGGTVTASWIPGEEDDAVLIVDEHPASAQFGYVLVTTDGDRDSMRRVIQGLRNTDEVLFITTRPALTSGITRDTLVANPYLTVMATAAAGLGTVALLYAVLLLFRQRQAEFRILRCQGATRMLLAADLGLLFAGPLVLAFGLAVAAGIGLAVTLNTAYDLPTQFGTARVYPSWRRCSRLAWPPPSSWRSWATRMPPLVTDPDAAAA